jgi:hypothetical protein
MGGARNQRFRLAKASLTTIQAAPRASSVFQTLLSSQKICPRFSKEKQGLAATYREKNSILRTSRRRDKALLGVKPSPQIQLGRAL